MHKQINDSTTCFCLASFFKNELWYIAFFEKIHNLIVNLLSNNHTKWSNTLKQFVGNLPTNCLSAFDHFMGSVLKGLSCKYYQMSVTSFDFEFLFIQMMTSQHWRCWNCQPSFLHIFISFLTISQQCRHHLKDLLHRLVIYWYNCEDITCYHWSWSSFNIC